MRTDSLGVGEESARPLGEETPNALHQPLTAADGQREDPRREPQPAPVGVGAARLIGVVRCGADGRYIAPANVCRPLRDRRYSMGNVVVGSSELDIVYINVDVGVYVNGWATVQGPDAQRASLSRALHNLRGRYTSPLEERRAEITQNKERRARGSGISKKDVVKSVITPHSACTVANVCRGRCLVLLLHPTVKAEAKSGAASPGMKAEARSPCSDSKGWRAEEHIIISTIIPASEIQSSSAKSATQQGRIGWLRAAPPHRNPNPNPSALFDGPAANDIFSLEAARRLQQRQQRLREEARQRAAAAAAQPGPQTPQGCHASLTQTPPGTALQHRSGSGAGGRSMQYSVEETPAADSRVLFCSTTPLSAVRHRYASPPAPGPHLQAGASPTRPLPVPWASARDDAFDLEEEECFVQLDETEKRESLNRERPQHQQPSAQGLVQGSGQGPAQGPVQGPVEGPLQGSGQGPVQGSGQGSGQGPVQGPVEGPLQGSGQGSGQGPVQGSGQGSDQGSDQGLGFGSSLPASSAVFPAPAVASGGCREGEGQRHTYRKWLLYLLDRLGRLGGESPRLASDALNALQQWSEAWTATETSEGLRRAEIRVSNALVALMKGVTPPDDSACVERAAAVQEDQQQQQQQQQLEATVAAADRNTFEHRWRETLMALELSKQALASAQEDSRESAQRIRVLEGTIEALQNDVAHQKQQLESSRRQRRSLKSEIQQLQQQLQQHQTQQTEQFFPAPVPLPSFHHQQQQQQQEQNQHTALRQQQRKEIEKPTSTSAPVAAVEDDRLRAMEVDMIAVEEENAALRRTISQLRGRRGYAPPDTSHPGGSSEALKAVSRTQLQWGAAPIHTQARRTSRPGPEMISFLSPSVVQRVDFIYYYFFIYFLYVGPFFLFSRTYAAFEANSINTTPSLRCDSLPYLR
eukprot:gene11403-7908_t